MKNYSDRSKWYSTLAAIVAATGLLFSVQSLAQESDDGAESDSADVGKLEVTGSRIKRLDVEGPSPVVVVTREEMEARGFATVYEALENLTQNTGNLFNNESFTNNFTPNLQSLSLRSLGGGRTLVLLNGRRAADYPQPENGQNNMFNFATIPTAAIERVEVLTGSASAVYGSDAIAGVINIILRDDVTAPTLTYRYGTTEAGGGDSNRLSFVWGKQFEKMSITVAAEHHTMDPIFGKDRDYLDSVEDAPQLSGNVPYTRSTLVLSQFFGSPTPDDWAGPDPYPGNYYDPGAATCENMQSQGVPYEYVFRDGSGFYCGRDDFGDESLQNKRDRSSVYVNLKADINDSVSFYTDAMYWESEAKSHGFHQWWGASVWDPNIISAAGVPGDYIYLQRVWHPNETGNQVGGFDESAINLSMGFEGSFSNFWTWKAGASYSTNDFKNTQPRFKEEVADAYFGGTQFVDVCVILGFGCSIVVRDTSDAQFGVYDVLDQADIDAVMGTMVIDSEASVWSVFGQFGGDLLEMPNGPLEFSTIVEFSRQDYSITPDDRLLDQTGNGWWGRSGTGGGGERDRSAIGVEFGIPLLENLRATVAARYDNYSDASNVGGAPTFGVGLEYRPNEILLLRGSYNTSFRAPDMHHLFAAPSGFFSSTRDIWQCRQEAIDNGVEYDELDCDGIGIAGSREGNLALEEEEGESLTVGFVVSPIDNLKINFDYFELELTQAVRDLSILQLSRDEADCQLGVTTDGDSVDINSALCADAISRITRLPGLNGGIPDIDSVMTGPINTSLRKQSGFDASLQYLVPTDSAGDFRFGVDYTHMLKDQRQVFDFDEIDRDFRDSLQNFNSRSTINVSVAWDYKDFAGVLYAHRLGSLPNWQETGRLPTWTTYNASGSMSFMDDNLTVTLVLNNLTDERPPVDDGFTSWPFFYRGQYNARGREGFVRLSYTFQ